MPSRRSAYVAALLGLGVTIAFVFYPETAFSASWDGLILWFEVVLPALLPFFAMAEILMGLGVIHAVGVLLEPLMRPVFRIPGVGGFAVAMGLASGYPLGAKISGRIRREGLCTQVEGERLVSFANTADPLFMIGAVAIGMFALPQVGLPIAVAHYIAAILVGFLMRYHAPEPVTSEGPKQRGPLLTRALDELVEARRRDGRPFGELFGDAVKESMNSMLFIGGCIMMFSVLLRIVSQVGVMDLITGPVELFISWLGLSKELAPAVLQGAMEITIGAQAASEAHASLIERTIAASAVIGWSGFSVHAQVAAMVYGTDIRMAPYLFARLMHGILAAIFTWVLFEPLGGASAALQTTAEQIAPGLMASPVLIYWGSALGLGGALLLVLLVASLSLHALRRIRLVVFRVVRR